MERRNEIIVGPVLILLGLLLLLGQLGVGSLGDLWPLFLVAFGGGMIFRWWRTRQDSGQVFVGTLLILLGFHFLAREWSWMPFPREWPFFLLAVGLSFGAMALADRDRKNVLIPAGILVVLALIFYLEIWGVFAFLFRALGWLFKVVLPLAMIAGGAWLLFGRRPAVEQAGWNGPDKVEPAAPPEPRAEDPATVTPVVEDSGGVEPVESEADFEEVEDETEAALDPEVMITPPADERPKTEDDGEPEKPEG